MRNRRCARRTSVNIGATADTVARCVSEPGSVSALRQLFIPPFGSPARHDEIGIPTAFNLLGPMANPGRVQRQVIGVADRVEPNWYSEHCGKRNEHVWVVHGNGLDELSTTGPSIVHELIDDTINTFTIDAAEFGLAPASQDDLTGGGPAENAEVVRNV